MRSLRRSLYAVLMVVGATSQSCVQRAENTNSSEARLTLMTSNDARAALEAMIRSTPDDVLETQLSVVMSAEEKQGSSARDVYFGQWWCGLEQKRFVLSLASKGGTLEYIGVFEPVDQKWTARMTEKRRAESLR
jgi:hypothetical protein